MSQKPKFRIMKNGYDRLEVDRTIDHYEKEINDLRIKLDVYGKKLEQSYLVMEEIRTRYLTLSANMEARQNTADNISKMALFEANSIIKEAQDNAEMIIKESLAVSRMIITDLSRIANDAEGMKSSMKEQISNLYYDVSRFKFPDLPDLKWLEEAEKQMQ